MADKAVSLDRWKESLRDVVAVILKLKAHCDSFDEMVDLLHHAVGDEETPGNDAQLRIILHILKAK